MSIRERFDAYAAAFEETVVDNDWKRLEQYFTEDATYETLQGSSSGRDEVIAFLQQSVGAFDQRMDGRRLETLDTREDDDSLTFRFEMTLNKAGAPDLILRGSETLHFRGDQIERMVDAFDEADAATMGEWTEKHGHLLAP